MYTLESTNIGADEYFILIRNGQNLGKCIVNYPEDYAFIKYICIKEEFRGNFLGKKLLIHVKMELKSRGINKIKLIAEELSEKHGKLIHFYESLGYIKNGNIKYQYNGDELIRKIPMVNNL
jgi:ribosomal protein S18 acetylase RimI-like enzyme